MATVIETENTRAISRLTQAIAELTAAFQAEVSYRQAAVAAALAEARAYADTVSAQQYVLPPAAVGTLGGVKPDGVTVTVDPDGTVRSHVDAEALPYASSATYGVVKVDGTTVVARNGVLTAVASSVSWNDVTDKPGADSALDGESENPVQNRVVTEAMDARPTETRVEIGWWGGWVYVGVPQGLSVVDNSHSAGTGWTLTLSNGLTADAEGDGDAGLLSWTFAPPSGDPFSVTAARSRFAGPVPRYVSQLVNDLGFVVTSDILSGGKVRSDLLPSYVDDVLEYGSTFDFPASGETGKIYVATGTNRTYRWSGTQYVQIGGSDTTVDPALSTTSENPVQNKVVTESLDAKCTVAEAVTEVTRTESGEWQWPETFAGCTYAPSEEWLDEHGDPSRDYYTIEYEGDFFLDEGAWMFSNWVWEDDGEGYGWTPGASEEVRDSDCTETDTSISIPFNFGTLTATGTPGRNAHGLARLVDIPDIPDISGKADKSEMSVTPGTGANADKTTIQLKTGTSATVLTEHQSLAGLMPKYGFETATVGTGNTLTVSPYTVATCTPTASAAFSVAVGALPTGVTGKARDCILVIDCTATGAVAPTVTWGTHFHPRTDVATDLAIVEAGKRAVFYISEYASGEFAVGGWVETDGGSAT